MNQLSELQSKLVALTAELDERESRIRALEQSEKRDRVGRFQLADRGTLFLDEVGEIPLVLQSKLLRVLQEGTFERIGESRARSVDVRVIAATNRNLAREVREGRFREDLYFRLNVFPIKVPPLRERVEDIGKVYGADGAAAKLGIKATTLASRLKKPGLRKAQSTE